jgi:tryptophan synthase alpha chain
VLFVTAGDQPLSDLPSIVDLLVEGGADLIEIGIPFSDPFGEGPTIQASSQRALDSGVNPDQILEAIAKCSKAVPIVTMGYYNTYLRSSLDHAAQKSRDAGICGAIISDLVPDEGQQWIESARANGLDTIFLAAPTSTDQRIEEVCQATTGFVYAVSRTGVTGTHASAPQDAFQLVNKIRNHTRRPICVGFGISTPDHVRAVCRIADGAVVGSFLVDLLHREWPQGRETVLEAIQNLKAATR